MNRQEFLVKLPELIRGYKPADDVIQQINNIALLMVVGPSGVGKTTLIQGSGLAYVPSDTTRPIRPEEKDGEDYFFRSDYDQIAGEILGGRFTTVAIGPGGDFYATRAASYPSSGIAIIAVVADSLQAFRNIGFKKTTSTFITPPSYDEWMQRLLAHRLGPEEFGKRMDEAKRSFSQSLADIEMHFILNEDVAAAEQQLVGLLAERVDEQRENAAKQAASEILAKLLSEPQ